MMRAPLIPALVSLLIAGATRSPADCAPFYESFNSSASIAANGGSVFGTPTFTSGVNGNAATWSAVGHVSYPVRDFRTAGGTVALWYKKTAATAAGGIWQIGNVGQPSSLGLFYLNTNDLCFEARSASGDATQVYVAGGVPAGTWIHVVASWREHDGACDLWLSINGAYRGWAQLNGTLSHDTATLQVGTTGYYGHGQGATDELRWFDWDLFDSEVAAEYVYSANRFARQTSSKPVSTGPVQLVNNRLYVNGQPFEVKGVGYAPTPIGYWNYSVYTDPAILARDVPLLQAAHVNTVRTWAQPPDAQLLDAMYNGGTTPIYTIVGFWVPISDVNYADPAVIAQYENSFRNLVSQFKSHPGLLAWGIGNEVNLWHSGTELASWYALANRLARVAYETEGAGYHPTILVNGGLMGLGDTAVGADDVSLSYIDIWGQNTYFGWDAHCFFDYYSRLSAKPLLFTEFGIDAYDDTTGVEYQDVQAAWEVRQWRQIRAGCLGGTGMAWSDEWWKADSPWTHDAGGYATKTHPDGFSNEEWWGLVSVEFVPGGADRVHPRQAYAALAQDWSYSLGDYDRDGDVDLHDLAQLQICCGADANSTGGTGASACGSAFEYRVDGLIDYADFAGIAARLSGPQ